MTEAALLADAPHGAPAASADAGGIIILINSDAGSVRRMGPSALRALARRTLQDTPAKVITTDRHDLREVLIEAAKERPRAIGVIGGDGTAHCALETLTPRAIPVAPLPGGTMNRLAARVFGRANLEQCLAALTAGRPKHLAGGRVGERTFYVAAGFGAWMQVQTLRERLRKPRGLTALRALKRMARRQFEDRLIWTPERGGPTAHSTLIVGVGRIDTALGFRAERHEPAVFEAAGADIQGWGDIVGIAAAALIGRWRHLDGVTSLVTRRLWVESEHEGTPALFDGEYHMLTQRNEIVFDRECGLVWAPPQRRAPW